MKTDRDLAVAWASGVFDGEGCITISRQRPGTGGRVNPSYRLYLKVTMGHRPTIDRLRSVFGVGSIHEQRSERYNTAWSWLVATRQAGEVLAAMRPHLVTKASEMEIAFRFLALPSGLTGGRRGNAPLSPAAVRARQELFEEMRDAKPSARFRAAKRVG